MIEIIYQNLFYIYIHIFSLCNLFNSSLFAASILLKKVWKWRILVKVTNRTTLYYFSLFSLNYVCLFLKPFLIFLAVSISSNHWGTCLTIYYFCWWKYFYEEEQKRKLKFWRKMKTKLSNINPHISKKENVNTGKKTINL